eukprot:gene663-10369_t
MLNSFFECFNVRSTKEGYFQRTRNLAPYREVTNSRFQRLETDFLGYFSAWKESIDKREGSFDESAHAKVFIHWQTHERLQTSVYSLIGLVQFLLQNGANYILSNKFCQDPVENILVVKER